MAVDALERGLQELAKPYRVRMVAIGLNESGSHFRLFTAIGGISIGSKNRVYHQERHSVRTRVFDPKLPSGDPAKIIYVAQDSVDEFHVISNGFQTGEIAFKQYTGISFAGTLQPLEHEGAGAANTSRIEGSAQLSKDLVYFGRVSANLIDPIKSDHTIYPREITPGSGYFISTYIGDGTNTASLEHPHPLPFRGTFDDNIELFWRTLDPKTTVALAGKQVNRETGDFHYHLLDRASEFKQQYLASQPRS